MRAVLLGSLCLALPLGLACDQAPQSQPYVQDSAKASPRWTVDLDRVLDGVYRPYRPRCMDSVRIGHTVEFRNYQPMVSADVTAIGSPQGAEPLYSPNLVRPYNYAAGEGEDAEPYSYWRHTFDVPGVYDWVNSQATTAGRQVVDPYYGTVTFVGLNPNTPFGTICVQDEAGEGCEQVCCASDDDCASGQRCYRAEVDAIGRCLTPSG